MQQTHPRLIATMLAVAFTVSGCFGQEGSSTVNAARQLEVVWVETTGQFLDGEPPGYSIVFSQRDADANGHALEYEFVRDPGGSARVFVDFDNFFYNKTGDDVPTRCFDDPIIIRDDTTGQDFGRIDGYCHAEAQGTILHVHRLFEPDIPASWSGGDFQDGGIELLTDDE